MNAQIPLGHVVRQQLAQLWSDAMATSASMQEPQSQQQRLTEEIAALGRAHGVDQMAQPPGRVVPLEQLRYGLSVLRADLNAVHSLQNIEQDLEQSQTPEPRRTLLFAAWLLAGAGGVIALGILLIVLIR